MESLATVIFERTPKGSAAAKSANDEVSRSLRTLLLAVDGRSPVAQYVPFLTAFAPLSEKFAELENMGYLQRKEVLPNISASRFERPHYNDSNALGTGVVASSPDAGFVGIRDTDLTALAGHTMAQQKISSRNAFELELLELARQMSGGVIDASASSGGQQFGQLSRTAEQIPEVQVTATTKAPTSTPATNGSGRPANPVLADLLREMEMFLSASAGPEALPVVLMLEQIKTLGQLRAALPDYSELVQRYGSQSDQHVKRLARLLDLAGG